MKCRVTVLLFLILCLPACGRSSGQSKAHRSSDISILVDLTDKLEEWFDEMSSSVNSIADRADRKKDAAALKQLQVALYEVESNGRDLVTQLQMAPLDKTKAAEAVKRTRDAVEALRVQLHQTGLKLRNIDFTKGAEAEQIIANAISRRNIWLSGVESEIRQNRISDQTIEVGVSILGSQRSASGELGMVIEQLERPTK